MNEYEMKYIDVNWIHDHPEDPIRLVSEIDESHWEIRKLEFFRDGSVGYASTEKNTKNTMLGLVEIPSLEYINSQIEFKGQEIEKSQFELLWKIHAS